MLSYSAPSGVHFVSSRKRYRIKENGVIHLRLSLHCVYNCIIIYSIFVFITLQDDEVQMLHSKQQLVVVELGS